MVALDNTTFLMDLHKHTKDLNVFLPFGGPSTLRTKRRGIRSENECDLF